MDNLPGWTGREHHRDHSRKQHLQFGRRKNSSSTPCEKEGTRGKYEIQIGHCALDLRIGHPGHPHPEPQVPARDQSNLD